MADTLSPTELDMDETELDMDELLQSIQRFFAQIIYIGAEDNFIQEKINQISIQIMRFGIFVEESISQSIKMQNYAGDLVVFAERCNGFSREVLLRILRSFSRDSRVYKSEATLLKQQIKSIINSLSGIAKEISEYNNKITKERKDANRGKIVAGLGFTAAVASNAFTGGASLAVFGLGSFVYFVYFRGIASIELNYQLEKLVRVGREMHNVLDNIITAIAYFESHWERQITEIEGIINLLERGEQRMTQLISWDILAKARKIGTFERFKCDKLVYTVPSRYTEFSYSK